MLEVSRKGIRELCALQDQVIQAAMKPASGNQLPVPDGRSLRIDGNNGAAELPGQSALLSAGLTLETWMYLSGEARGNEVFIAFGGGSQGTSVQLWRDHKANQFILSVGRGTKLPSFRFALPRTARVRPLTLASARE